MSNINNKKKFHIYWKEANGILSGYIRNFIFNQKEFDDILHDVAHIAIKKFQKFDPDKSFTSWVVGIAKYEILARRKKYSQNPLIYNGELFEQISDHYIHMLPEISDKVEALKECISNLDEENRKFLVARYSDSRKIKEIAQESGIRPVTLRVRLNRLRTSLKKCIKERLTSQYK